MKKLFASFLVAAVLLFSVASTSAASFPAKPGSETPVLNANTILLPVGNTGNTISLMDLAYIKVKDFETLSKTKMKVWDKLSFKMSQRQLRHNINPDGTLKQDMAKKLAKGMADGTSGFHLGGFALGFLLGLIGVIIAYVIKDEKKSNRVKWAWIGLAAVVVLVLLL